jgi:hypothetical protein
MPASRVRVVSIIEISHLTAMQSSLLADHDAFGWIIFTVLLLAFFLAARRLAVGIPLRTRPPVAPPPSLASGARAVAIGTAALVTAAPEQLAFNDCCAALNSAERRANANTDLPRGQCHRSELMCARPRARTSSA